MHKVLQIQEILQNIFSHCWWSPTSLAALATTCRTFKEPAPDVLWRKLDDPSPLANCLPEASHHSQADLECYSFSRSLTLIEWGILRSYTRRIRSLSDESWHTLDWGSVRSFLNPPTTEPLFPNLCVLHAGGFNIQHLLSMPFPSLVVLHVWDIAKKDLLSQTRLPAITDVTAYIESCPSKQRFSSFMDGILTTTIGRTIQKLTLEELECPGVLDGEDGVRVFKFEDLQPCMAFSNFHRIYLDLSWDVDLTDSELLALASAWPHLEAFVINMVWGWHTQGGLTPNGVLQLFQTCRSLSLIALAIDTRGYTEFRESPASLGLTLPPTFSIRVLDSLIEEESVLAIAAFLAGITPHPYFSFSAGCPGSAWDDCKKRWYDAYERANNALSQR
ncbi:hypothetical protein OG21DRAFT_1607411 [Imleria badia]|nr:hypothetical protein OG21DRAFT_1607411 [Imleria badia]